MRGYASSAWWREAVRLRPQSNLKRPNGQEYPVKMVWNILLTGVIAVAAVAIVKRIPNQKLV